MRINNLISLCDTDYRGLIGARQIALKGHKSAD
jgi:hypothetical protein